VNYAPLMQHTFGRVVNAHVRPRTGLRLDTSDGCVEVDPLDDEDTGVHAAPPPPAPDDHTLRLISQAEDATIERIAYALERIGKPNTAAFVRGRSWDIRGASRSR